MIRLVIPGTKCALDNRIITPKSPLTPLKWRQSRSRLCLFVDVQVNILTSRPDYFMLMSLPCKVVYEIETDKPTFAGIRTRRCGLSFEQLSRAHSEQLKVMLAHYVSYSLGG